MTESTRNKLQLKLYKKYEYLANHYSSKIFGFENYGYEKEDITQELRIKIYNSINTYVKKMIEYKATGRYKPVPIEYYLKTSMINRTKDFIKMLNAKNIETSYKLSIEENSYDAGTFSNMTSQIDYKNCVVIINDVDFLYKLTDRQKKCFCLYLKGFEISKLKKIFKDISMSFISEQREYLKNREKDLLDYRVIEYKHFEHVENN